jgi:hypothetical protein
MNLETTFYTLGIIYFSLSFLFLLAIAIAAGVMVKKGLDLYQKISAKLEELERFTEAAKEFNFSNWLQAANFVAGVAARFGKKK